MNVKTALLKLETAVKNEQIRGTKKLEESGTIYNDGTIEGVIDKISSKGTDSSNIIYSDSQPAEEVYTN